MTICPTTQVRCTRGCKALCDLEPSGSMVGPWRIEANPIQIREPACYAEVSPGLRWAFYNRPNRWHRFWYWALLGWTFTEPDRGGDGD